MARPRAPARRERKRIAGRFHRCCGWRPIGLNVDVWAARDPARLGQATLQL